ncbi:MAG: DNA polymerase III subunit delta' C-terminal domain-containing protein [Bacillota bacterium]|nr:DNA polymerase III subunit delta' C-terminal domain-containing protein [Bacillota bacterium]
MGFDNIIGQKELIDSLKKSIINNRTGHAYILCGPQGIGKRTLASAFAGALLCSTGKGGESCGTCIPCRMFETGSIPDLFIIDTGDSGIGVNDIRKLQGDIIVKPLYSKRKVYIIADADKMTVQAQNCLLKTLEEPPEYAVIILTVSNPGLLLETIRSRTVKYTLGKNTIPEVVHFLKLKYSDGLANADFISAFSGGIIGRAAELAKSEEFFLLRDKAIDIVLKLSGTKLIDVFTAYDFFEKNKESIDTVFDIMLLFYRDLLIASETGSEKMLINSDKKDIILDNVSLFSVPGIAKSIKTIEETRKNIKQNVNYQLSIEVMLMKLQEEYI